MNFNKILYKIGFKKTSNLKLEKTNYYLNEPINGRYYKSESKFIIDDDPDKWTWTYVYPLNKSLRVIAKLYKQNDLSLYVEDLDNKNVSSISMWADNYKKDKIPIDSFQKLVSFLPKEIQRDILISKIMKYR